MIYKSEGAICGLCGRETTHLGTTPYNADYCIDCLRLVMQETEAAINELLEEGINFEDD